MFAEEIALRENFIAQEHIDEVYCAFVNYCSLDSNQLILHRYNCLSKEIYQQLSNNFDESEITKKYNLIDLNHDLSVCFQDFLKFILINFKLLSADISAYRKFEKLSIPITDQEISDFHSLIKDIIFPLDMTNPFLITRKMQAFYAKYTPYYMNLYNSKGELKALDPAKKIEYFNNNFFKIFNFEYLKEISYSLNNEDYSENFRGTMALAEIIKSLGLITNHFEIQHFFLVLIESFEIIIRQSNILAPLVNFLYFYNVETNNKFYVSILKIIRRVYSTLIKMDELIDFHKENNIRTYKDYYDKFDEILNLFENNFLQKILGRLEYLNTNKANNFYYLNQIILLGLEISKRNKTYLILYFEGYSYLEILYLNLMFLENSENYSTKIPINNIVNSNIIQTKADQVCNISGNYTTNMPAGNVNMNQNNSNVSNLNSNININNPNNNANSINTNNYQNFPSSGNMANPNSSNTQANASINNIGNNPNAETTSILKSMNLDINTLVNGKASNNTYNINLNTINYNNKNCEEFHFYQIRKFLLFCIKLTYQIFISKRDNQNEINAEFKLLIDKLRYIFDISLQFFYETNDNYIIEYAIILKSLLSDNDKNFELDFLNNSLNKVLENNNLIISYNMLVKNQLKNASSKVNVNLILTPKYLNIIKELMFFSSSPTQNTTRNPNYQENTNNILNIELFKDFIEISNIINNINLNLFLLHEHLLIFYNTSLDIFQQIFENFERSKIELSTVNSSANNLTETDNINNNASLDRTIFYMNDKLLKIILNMILQFLLNETTVTSLNLLRKNFVYYITDNLNLFLSKNMFYIQNIKIDYEIYELQILRSAFKIFEELLETDYTTSIIELFIKFLNLDFLNNIKEIFNSILDIYHIKTPNDSKKWILFNKYLSTLENIKYQTFLHYIFLILKIILQTYDEFIFTLYLKKKHPNFAFNLQSDNYDFFSDNTIKDNIDVSTNVNSNITVVNSNINNPNPQYSIKCTRFTKANNLMLNPNNEVNYSMIDDNAINYFNLNILIGAKKGYEKKLSNFIYKNYNLKEICSIAENIFIDANDCITQIFLQVNSLYGADQSSIPAAATKNNVNLYGIKNIKFILQTEEEKINNKANILKIDNIINCSFKKLKNDIKLLYNNEDYDIFYYSKAQNLKIKINSNDDLIEVFLEKKKIYSHPNMNLSLSNSNAISNNNLNLTTTGLALNMQMPNQSRNLNFSAMQLPNQTQNYKSEFLSEIEIILSLEKAEKAFDISTALITICPSCHNNHYVSKDEFDKYNEKKLSYNLFCKSCKEISFQRYLKLMENVNSIPNIEKDLSVIFPNLATNPGNIGNIHSVNINPTNPNSTKISNSASKYFNTPNTMININPNSNKFNLSKLNASKNLLNSINPNDINSFNNLTSISRNNPILISNQSSNNMGNANNCSNQNIFSQSVKFNNPSKPNNLNNHPSFLNSKSSNLICDNNFNNEVNYNVNSNTINCPENQFFRNSDNLNINNNANNIIPDNSINNVNNHNNASSQSQIKIKSEDYFLLNKNRQSANKHTLPNSILTSINKSHNKNINNDNSANIDNQNINQVFSNDNINNNQNNFMQRNFPRNSNSDTSYLENKNYDFSNLSVFPKSTRGTGRIAGITEFSIDSNDGNPNNNMNSTTNNINNHNNQNFRNLKHSK